MKFLAEDFNCPKLVACFKVVNYQAIFKNGIHARFLGKLTQYAVIMLWRNVDQYFQGSRTINPLKPSFSCMMAHILHCFGDSVKDEERGRSSFSCHFIRIARPIFIDIDLPDADGIKTPSRKITVHNIH